MACSSTHRSLAAVLHQTYLTGVGLSFQEVEKLIVKAVKQRQVKVTVDHKVSLVPWFLHGTVDLVELLLAIAIAIEIAVLSQRLTAAYPVPQSLLLMPIMRGAGRKDPLRA